jgi:hypothetical protein
VERDITAPNKNREEKGVLLEGGDTGNNEKALSMAIRNHATA